MNLHEYLLDDPACTNLVEGAIMAVAPLLEDSDPAPVLKTLDDWAFELAGHMPLPWNLHQAIDALNHYFVQELGFRGDTEAYDRPENAVLPSVMSRRRGLPIALSILWIDLARRLGLDAVGVGLPGHFIAGLRLEMGSLYFDPFHGCRAMGEEEAAKLVERTTGGHMRFQPAMLDPLTHRGILTRLVRNLYVRFMKTELWSDALWTATHLVLLNPEEAYSYRDRALVHLKRKDMSSAMTDLLLAQRLIGDTDPQLREWIRKIEES